MRLNFKKKWLYAGILVAGTFAASCSNKEDYNFESSEQAVERYDNYLRKLRQQEKSDGKAFADDICKWREFSDTVFKYMYKDSAFTRKQNLGLRYYAISDSIKREFFRLTETWKVTYDDVFNIKVRTSSWIEDQDLKEAVREATPFFESLDKNQKYVFNKTGAIAKYRSFLERTKINGISNKEEMLSFIKEEDMYYRTFLSHLYEMENDRLSDITKNTEDICLTIFSLAKQGKIPARDVMVYMCMRTTRRILLNSSVCVNDINNYKMKSKVQGNAYLWMILQPYMGIDAFSIATLTQKDKDEFHYISEMLSNSNQFAQTFNIDLSVLRYLLPQQLLKMYILNL